MSLILIIELLLIGVCTSILSTLFGIGGGVIIVSTFYLLLPKVAATTIIISSLIIIFINSLINTSLYIFRYEYRLPYGHLLYISVPMGITTAITTSLSKGIPDIFLKQIFGVMLLVVACEMLWKWRKKYFGNSYESREPARATGVAIRAGVQIQLSPLGNFLLLFTGGITCGIYSGLTGLGGGVLLIPFFKIFFKLPTKQIPIYTNFIMLFAILPLVMLKIFGVDFDLQAKSIGFGQMFSNINHSIILWPMIGLLIGGPLGTKLHQKFNEKMIEILLALLLLFMGLRLTTPGLS